MLPTPSTSHVCFDRVYEPAEDSFLLLDTLSSATETAFLHTRFSGHSTPGHVDGKTASDAPLILEVGVGSGVVLAFVAANSRTLFGRDDILALGTDINGFACQAAACTLETACHAQNGSAIFLDVANADLASSVMSFSVDVLIFNPPYVPAELPDLRLHDRYNFLSPSQKKTSFDQDSYLLSLSYAGGPDGMEVTNRMLEELPRILHPSRGVAYILLCAQNKPDEVKQRIRNWGYGWLAETVGSSGKQAGWEKLQIVRIWKPIS